MKKDPRDEWVDERIRDLNTVIRSISQPREGETGADVGKRYVQGLLMFHAHGLQAAKQYFDKPPKETK